MKANPDPAFRKSLIIVALAVTGCLSPFANKAVHMDDPLFVWTAKHIQQHPADFYGFNVNWYGTDAPIAEITKNPPLASYYLALAGSLFGWNEVPLHLAMLLPAIAAALGACFLAREFGANPLLTGLITIFSPVFLVSSSSLMCDTLMLAFWVWAVLFWIRGMREGRGSLLFSAAVLITLSAFTKYFGVCLVPLLGVYTWARERRLGSWIAYLLLPVMFLVLFQAATARFYGHGLFSDAISYATSSRERVAPPALARGVSALTFLGGCMVLPLFCAPLIWSRRTSLIVLLTTTVVMVPFVFWHPRGLYPFLNSGGFRWGLFAQMAIWTCAGIAATTLALREWMQRRDPDALLMLLWLGGTVCFAALINWTINARTLLPCVPVAAVILSRRLEPWLRESRARKWIAFIPIGMAAALSLAITWSDCQFANNARVAAQTFGARYARRGARLWFMGHWGFQYYMQEQGAKPFELANIRMDVGDIAAIPSMGSNMYDLFDLGKAVMTVEKLLAPHPRWFTTIDTEMGENSPGAGFYSYGLGPVPYVFARVNPEFFMVYLAREPVEYHYVSEQDRRAAEKLFKDANGFLSQGRLKQAEVLFTVVVKLAPDYAEAHYQLGAIEVGEHRAPEAIAHLKQAIHFKPDWLEPINNLAWIRATATDASQRNGAEAVELAERAVQLSSTNHPGTLDTLAAAYAEAGRFADATNVMVRALALLAKDPDARREFQQHMALYASGKPLRQ